MARNGDSTLATAYPLGDKPTAGLTWSLSLSLTNLTTGSSYSSNVRASLSGANAASAVITIVTVSGDDAATEGWAISSSGTGNNLTHPGNQTGAGFFKLRATFGGQSSDSPAISWNWVAPSASDTLAPTIPTGFTVTAIDGGVTITHDAASDPYDGSNAAALVKDYRVKKNGSVIATITSGVAQGLSPTYTLTNLGTISSPGAPSYTQNGAGGSITAAGTGIHGTQSDQCAFLNADFSGDFTVIAKLNAFTSAYQYSTFGIMIRETNAVNAPFVAVYVQPSSPGNGLQVKRRATPTSNSANRASVTTITASYVRLKRVGSTITAAYSTTGGAWTDIVAVSDAPMQADVKAGMFLASQQAGTAVTAVFEQLSVNNAAALSYNVTTTGVGTFTATCRDNLNNESVASLGISATPLSSAPPDPAHRFLPGHYTWFTPKTFNPSTSTGLSNQAALFSLIDSIASGGSTDIKGVQITLPWLQLEGPTQGNYTRAFATLDPIFAKCNAVSPKKYVCLSVLERGFGNGGTAANYLPEYLVSAGEYIEAPAGTTYSGGLKSAAAQWHAVVTDWLLGLLTAIANRYDTNAVFAMIGAGETSIGFPSGATFPNGQPADYTFSAFNTQVRRIFTEGKKVFLNTPMRLNANFYGAESDMASLIDFVHTTTYTGGVVVGGPDPEMALPIATTTKTVGGVSTTVIDNTRTITANEVHRGNTQVLASDGNTYWKVGGGTDRRAKIPWVGEWQEFGMEGVRAGYNEPPSDIDDYQRGTVGANNVMNARYIIWLNQTYTGNTGQKWPAIKSYIENTINGAITTTPPTEGNWV